MTVEEYDRRVKEFFAEAVNPTLKRPYRECGFYPMVELLRYLESMALRPTSPPGVIVISCGRSLGTCTLFLPSGSSAARLGITYSAQDGQSALLYKGAMDFFDDGPEKPVRIWSRIGRRPILAFGNSNGDVPMLAYSRYRFDTRVATPATP